jgi:hypothetical protein
MGTALGPKAISGLGIRGGYGWKSAFTPPVEILILIVLAIPSLALKEILTRHQIRMKHSSV